MRIARVIGQVTLSRRLPEMKSGSLLLVDVLDEQAVIALPAVQRRASPMPESLVAYDELGAGLGQLVAISEGREASMPFHPGKVPIDAYCAAILDEVEWQEARTPASPQPSNNQVTKRQP